MDKLYLALVHIVMPRRFVRRYGRDLLEVYRADKERPENRGGLGRILFWHELMADLVGASLRLRVRAVVRALNFRPSPPLVLAGATGGESHHSLPQEAVMPTANERLKESADSRFWLSMLLATALHAGVFYAFPTMSAAVEVADESALVVMPALDIPIPPPPAEIRPPARPAIVAGAVDLEIMPPTDAEVWRDAPGFPPPPVVEGPVGGHPVWTGPVQVQPRLENRAEIARALEAYYPPLLRDAGIGGSVHVAFFVISDGTVADRRIHAPSGHAALDEAALKVADLMRFSPAMNREKPVSVWVALPIEFTTKR
ncbi:MAG: energy transducer TonB [Longimicrobiales bacterium]